MDTWHYVAGVPKFVPCEYIMPNGKHRKASVKYSRLMGVDTARIELALGNVAYVKPEDADSVLATLMPVP